MTLKENISLTYPTTLHGPSIVFHSSAHHKPLVIKSVREKSYTHQHEHCQFLTVCTFSPEMRYVCALFVYCFRLFSFCTYLFFEHNSFYEGTCLGSSCLLIFACSFLKRFSCSVFFVPPTVDRCPSLKFLHVYFCSFFFLKHFS